MNTYKRAHIFCKAKARRQCFFLILCFHLVLGDVPGPCKHSVTKDHLLKIKQLIENQLQNGCSITYTFTERQNLSKICYVKAAFPQVLELLKTHFQYVRSSDNYRYVFALKTLVFNIYSQKCVPEINEEIEDNPVRYVKKYSSSLREALDKIREVIQLHMELMTENNKPVDWNCEEEFAEDYPESTTEIVQTTGATECQCSCPTLGHGASEQVSLPDTSLWNYLSQRSSLQSHSSLPPKLAQPPIGTMNPWDHLSANYDHDLNHIIKAANSKINSVRKEEKEKINGNRSSSPESVFPGTAIFGSTLGSTASFDEEKGDPKDTSTSPYLRVKLDLVSTASGSLDETQPSPMSTESMQGMNVFVSSVVSEKGSLTMMSSTQNEIATIARGPSTRHTFFDLHHVTISPSKESDSPTTAIPFQQAPVGGTPNRPEESTAVALAKRSLGPGLQFSSETDTQNWIPTNSPLVPSVSSDTIYKNIVPEDTLGELNDLATIPQAGKLTRTTMNTIILPTRTIEDTSRALSGLSERQSHDPLVSTNSCLPVLKRESLPTRTIDENVESPGLGSQSTGNLLDSDSSSEQPVRDSGKGFQNETQEGSHISYKIAFIMASVCGGLLLIITLYCFKKQKKLKALLHSSKVQENQRLTLCSKDIERQHCETTEQSGLQELDSS